MRKVLPMFMLVALSSCEFEYERTKDQDTEKKREQANTKDTVQKKKKYDFWTPSNAEKRLRKFGQKNPEKRAILHTDQGDIIIKLYDDTPLHRANFVRLSKMDFYDSTLFFRVKKNFMIQGGLSDRGDTYKREAKTLEVGQYRIPSEIKKKYAHTKGALAMANNSSWTRSKEDKDFSSDPLNFYIVDGKNVTNNLLRQVEQEYNLDISPAHKKKYLNRGGAPHLDQQYTVFGHVIKGMDVVNKIARVSTDQNRRPKKNIYIKSVDVE